MHPSTGKICWKDLGMLATSAGRLEVQLEKRFPAFPAHLRMRPVSGGNSRGQEEKGTTEDEMAGWHH